MSTNYNSQGISPEYAPISMWGYFGYEILFSIPVIGLIFLIVFAIGARNVNVKNFARSYFCILIILLIVVGILVAVYGATGLFNQIAPQLAPQMSPQM